MLHHTVIIACSQRWRETSEEKRVQARLQNHMINEARQAAEVHRQVRFSACFAVNMNLPTYLPASCQMSCQASVTLFGKDDQKLVAGDSQHGDQLTIEYMNRESGIHITC